MAGKTLGEVVASQQVASSPAEEFTNRQGKTLPGYTPVSPHDYAAQDKKYLYEQPDAEFQLEEEDPELELPEEEPQQDVPEEEQQAEMADPELTDEERAELERRRVEIVQQENAELEARHKELMAKLDQALADEKQRAKDLYAIENHKKNTMDYARKVYGDQADVEKIMDSAEIARSETSREVKGLTGEISAQMDAALHQNNQVTVLMPNGQVRTMDKDVAEALSLYTERSREGTFEAAAAGITSVDRKLEEFQFTRHEEEKLAELQRRMAENDKQAAKFEQKAPETMTQEEYDAWNRERRFKEFGYPDAGYDYVVTREGVYEWNGRPLPSAMSSPAMQREMEQEKQEPSMAM